MRPGIELRPDYDAAQLWALAKATRDAGQSRRLLALAEIYDGGSRTKAARIGGRAHERSCTACGTSRPLQGRPRLTQVSVLRTVRPVSRDCESYTDSG